MSAIPTFANEQTGETICADHAGRYLTAALKKRPDLKTTNTPLGRWIRVDGDVHTCESCISGNYTEMCDMCDERTYHVKNQCQQCGHQVAIIRSAVTTTPSKENTMPIAIATPVKKTAAKKPAAKKPAAKKETPVPAKTTTAKKPVAKKPVAKKPTPAKAAPAKKTPAVKNTNEAKLFLVYRNITNDVTAQARKAKSFDPIRYEGVLSGKTIVQARKALQELKGEEYAQYDLTPTYDPKRLSQAALAKFDGATEKVVTMAKDTYKVTLRNIEGLSQDEVQELALYAWIVDAGKKASKPVGNERMLDRDFDFGDVKPLKNGRANVTFVAK